MGILIAGLVAFFIIHTIPFSSKRDVLVSAISEKGTKGIVALGSLASFVLIVLGWQATEIDLLYMPPEWGRHVTHLFALIGILLFIASNAPTNIRRKLRHPQLTGVAIWALGHLFANGETRSVILFGFFILFSHYAMFASNKRDGEWVKRDPVPVSRDIVTVVIGLIVFGALFHFHESFTGMPVMP